MYSRLYLCRMVVRGPSLWQQWVTRGRSGVPLPCHHQMDVEHREKSSDNYLADGADSGRARAVMFETVKIMRTAASLVLRWKDVDKLRGAFCPAESAGKQVTGPSTCVADYCAGDD